MVTYHRTSLLINELELMVVPDVIANRELIAGVVFICQSLWRVGRICDHKIAIDLEVCSSVIANAIVYTTGERIHNRNRLTVTSASPRSHRVVTSKIGSLSGFLSQPGSERTSRRITAKVNRCRNAFIYPANRKISEPWRPSPSSEPRTAPTRVNASTISSWQAQRASIKAVMPFLAL